MIERIRNALAKRWLRQQGIKLSHGICSIPKNGHLIVEEGVSASAATMRFAELKIGAMTYIRSNAELLNIAEIGRFCSISNSAILGQEKGVHAHPLSWVSTHPFQFEANEPPPAFEAPEAARIGHDVWIGRDVMVMEGVRVGTGAVIASRSLVTRDVPEYAIVAGVPARVVRFRHPPELARRLLDSRWWELDLTALRQLPLGRPEEFLLHIKGLPPAHYRSCQLTRGTWKSSKADS